MGRGRAIILGGLALSALLVGAALLILLSQVWAPPPQSPLDAGREWFVPKNRSGIPDRTIDDGARILASTEIAAGERIILYAWRPSETTPPTALNIVPLGIQYKGVQTLPWHPRRGWHPSGTAGRPATIPSGADFYAGSLPAGFTGFGKPIATAWGISARGNQVQITWSDGAVTTAPLVDTAFLQTRPDPNYPQQLAQRLSVLRITILDEQGVPLAQQEIPRSIVPEVRGP